MQSKKAIYAIVLIICVLVMALSTPTSAKTQHTLDKMLIFWGSFGATAFFLIWLNFVRFWPLNKNTAESQEAAELSLSIPWLVFSLVALVLFVWVLGPGIGELPPQILD